MAKAFVRQLPRIPSCDLPGDASCQICVQPYENLTTDSGSFERAVALPCCDKHIFGSECLTEWLTHGKNCPFCRRAVVLPRAAAWRMMDMDRNAKAMTFSIVGDQAWDEYWYEIFWILHLQGDRAVECAWHQWRQAWMSAAEEWDQSCQAQARATLSLSPLITIRQAGDPSQENKVLHELDRRRAFEQVFVRMPRISKRALWNSMRDIGFVWIPDWDASWADFPGRWSRYAC